MVNFVCVTTQYYTTLPLGTYPGQTLNLYLRVRVS